jgi:DNA-binding CsgD family transcriptional regulator
MEVRAQAAQMPGRPAATPVAGLDAVRVAVARTLQTAGSELCLCLSSTLDERRLAPHPLIAEAAARGARVRILHERQGGSGFARQLAAAGADVRLAARIPSRMLIADRRVALVLPPTAAALNSPAMAVGRSAVLTALIEHFELLWDLTPAAGSPAAPSRGEVTGRDAEILRLLGAGLTDDAVAAHLGSSARTVRRRVAALMREAEASTRFQAGVEAARRGWL